MNNTAPKILTDWANSISTRNPNVMTNFYTDNSILLATYEDLCVGIDEIYKYFIEFSFTIPRFNNQPFSIKGSLDSTGFYVTN